MPSSLARARSPRRISWDRPTPFFFFKTLTSLRSSSVNRTPVVGFLCVTMCNSVQHDILAVKRNFNRLWLQLVTEGHERFCTDINS